MANARAIRKRIKSVGSTKKITRTMELVSTAKSKRAQDRVVAARPYARGLADLLEAVRGAGAASHPLLRENPAAPSEALLVVTANRGLCGGFNANVLRMARGEVRPGVELHVVGRKGIAFFTYAGVAMAARHTDLPDAPAYADAERILEPFLRGFTQGALRRVRVVSTRFVSASRQQPQIETILPVAAVPADGPGAAGPGPAGTGPLWDPAPGALLDELLPLVVRARFLALLMEHAVSEQIARRIAMKNATDSAQEMIRLLTRHYNRTRQSQITQQIAEIVGGAEAIS